MNIPAGTFTPHPQRAPAARMALAQGAIESKLLLRHGEQLLLNIVIPAVMLVIGATVPVLGEDPNLDHIVPMVFAVAASSSGFTGQAIALAFDRRYGALKRTGASGVPASTIIVGKILGVLSTVAVQILVLSVIALLLGWRVDPDEAAAGLVALLFGVAAFTSLGLLMGGSQSSELVLALANLLWLVLMGVLGWVAYSGDITAAGWWNLAPSVALAAAMAQAFDLTFAPATWASLLAWTVVGIAAASRWFRFDG